MNKKKMCLKQKKESINSRRRHDWCTKPCKCPLLFFLVTLFWLMFTAPFPFSILRECWAWEIGPGPSVTLRRTFLDTSTKPRVKSSLAFVGQVGNCITFSCGHFLPLSSPTWGQDTAGYLFLQIAICCGRLSDGCLLNNLPDLNLGNLA